MANDETKAASHDAFLIDMTEDDEVEYWAKKFRVSKERLAEAVTKAGDAAEAVEEDLRKP